MGKELSDRYSIRAAFKEKEGRSIVSEFAVQFIDEKDNSRHSTTYTLQGNKYLCQKVSQYEHGYLVPDNSVVTEDVVIEDILKTIELHRKKDDAKITSIKLIGSDKSYYSFSKDTIDKGVATLEDEVIASMPIAMPNKNITLHSEIEKIRRKGGNEVG